MKKDEMPIGFGMALAQNPDAMQRFAMLDEAEQQKLIDGTHAIRSREEMHRYVNQIVTGNTRK